MSSRMPRAKDARIDAPRPRPGIEAITLYTPGVAPAMGANTRKLSSNENIFGPSPKAVEAVREAAITLWRYPSADHKKLREAICARHDIPSEQIICGAGSDEILALIAHCYAGPGDEVIITEHGFEIYGIVTRAAGATPVIVKEKNRRVDGEAIISAITPRTRIIYIANPANPTGTALGLAELEKLADAIPSNVLLVIDSAYGEFAPIIDTPYDGGPNDGAPYDGGKALALSRPNIIMTRTFSKLYGLGGLRVGWAAGPQAVIDNLNRIRPPFNLSTPAMEGAIAALSDQEHVQSSLARILSGRADLTKALRSLGLGVDESFANFVLARFESEDRANAAREYLAENGYLVRAVGHYGLGEALRITIGTEEDCQAVAKLLGEFLEAKNG